MDLICATDRGLYCEQDGFFIDPWQPVDRAVITHAHADHARWGSRSYLCAAEGIELLRTSLGANGSVEGLAYGEQLNHNGVRISFHPSGHILGSAQIRVESGGEVWVVGGDYKREPDTTNRPFETVTCNVFISECTFGLPIFRWRSQELVFAEINDWWQASQEIGRTCVLYAYALGKAQRILAGLDTSLGPVLAHGAVANMTEVYRSAGISLPDVEHANDDNAKGHGHCAAIRCGFPLAEEIRIRVDGVRLGMDADPRPPTPSVDRQRIRDFRTRRLGRSAGDDP